MNEIEMKNLEIYNKKFEDDPTTFSDYDAFDYIKILKDQGNNDEAIEVGSTFLSICPNLRRYINQYGYALYNKYINLDDDKIEMNENLFYDIVDNILSICKQEKYSPVEATINRVIKYLLAKKRVDYAKLNNVLDKLDISNLSDKPFINNEGKEFESKKERYYRLKIRSLYEIKDYHECIKFANNALSLSLKWHYNSLQWIKYYRGCSLVEIEDYDEAERVFLSLHSRIRGINFYEVLYKVNNNLGHDKKANTYLLTEFFELGYNIDLLPMYLRLKEATDRTNTPAISEVVDSFIYKIMLETNNSKISNYNCNKKYQELNSSELYDRMYDEIMSNLNKYLDRSEGVVVYYNQDNSFGSISRYDEDNVFFRQSDYVYDEEIQRGDKVEYTLINTYDNKKDRITTKAILIITTEEYTNYGY